VSSRSGDGHEVDRESQLRKLFVVCSALFVGGLFSTALPSHVVAQWVNNGCSYSAPTVQYSTPTYSAAPAYGYSVPYGGTPYGNQTFSSRPPVRFKDPYTSYNPWYSVAPPTYSDYTYNQRFPGPNESYARAFNNANNLNYSNGILPGIRGGLNRSTASERDDILRAKAFTQARGLTWDNGLIRGFIGASIRNSARD